jgi:protein TonB
LAADPARVQEPTIPTPAEARSTSPRPARVEIVAITADDALLEQLGQALDGDSLIRHADSPEEAHGLVSSSQPSVVLLDARGFDDLAKEVTGLQADHGARIVVIFAPAEASDEVARSLRGSAAFAVLTIPVVQPQAAAVLEGACEEARARHALLQQPASPAPTPPAANSSTIAVEEAPEPETWVPAPSSKPPRVQARGGGTRKLSPALGAGVVALLVAAVAVGYWMMRTPAPEAEEAQSSPVAAVEPAPATEPSLELEALQDGSVEELLDSARAAMRERRYTDPENDNAYTYYRSVLAQDPANGEAREGLDRIAIVLQERMQASLDAQRFDEAGRTLAQLRAIRPDDPAVARLQASLHEVRTRWQAEQERRQATERAGDLAELVSLRIRQGKLLDPANDSAKHYLGQLRRAGDPERTERATTELQQAYLGKLREALARSQRAEADRWKAEARAIGVSAKELNALQREVTARAAVTESKQEAAQIAQLVQERIASGRLLEPAGDSAIFHLNALRALDPTAAVVASSERALSNSLLERGRFALAEQRLDVARTHVAAARQLGVNMEAVAALERDIGNAGADPRSAGSSSAPKLVRTRYVAPEYPSEALKEGVAGSVRLRLIVDAQGRVSEAVVVESTPSGVFDTAAVNAVRKWRFKPIGEKGSDVTATATVELKFQPEDDRK